MANGNVEKLAEGVYLKLFSRYAVIAMTAFFPVVGYFGHRMIESNDRAVSQIQETATSVRLMQQEIKDARAARDAQFATFGRQLDDHETRIRVLERH